MTISASAGTSRSTVLARVTLMGPPASAPATASSSRVSGNFCTEAYEITGGQPTTTAQGRGSPRALHFSQWAWRLDLSAVVADVLDPGLGILGDIVAGREIRCVVPSWRRDRHR